MHANSKRESNVTASAKNIQLLRARAIHHYSMHDKFVCQMTSGKRDGLVKNAWSKMMFFDS